LNDQLTWISDSIQFLWPELTLTFAIVAILLSSLFRRDAALIQYVLCLICLLAEGIFLITAWPESPVSLFNAVMRTDDFSAVLRLLFAIAALLTLLMNGAKGSMDYFLMIMSVTLGANLLVMSNHFIMIVIAMELISIPSYVLTLGGERAKERSEAAWKFFLFGSASTAVMIFGMSYLFGLTGTLNFASTEFLGLASAGAAPMVVMGGLLTLGGLLFKMSAVPFHLWVPDVYESVPTPVAAFFSVVPKLAGLGATIKLSLALHQFGQSPIDWSLVVGAAAAISILTGSVAALAQTDAKRMMAWSSVAQAGFLLAGVSSFTIEGVHVTLFYAAIFVAMNFVAFIFIDALEKTSASAQIDLLAGMGRRAVVPSIGVTIGLVSLTGLPPTAGFMAKLLLFTSLWEKYASSHGGLFLVVLATGLICTVIGLFFYLRIPYFLFFKDGGDKDTIKMSWIQNLLSAILVTVLLALFFSPGWLMAWLNKVSFVL
jgi:NADH-quinone oxidoreductase subunit N